MTLEEMVEWLKDEVTMSGSINVNLSDAEYKRIIEKETLKIYEKYPDSLETRYCIIPRQNFYTKEFRQNRMIQFPSCVLSVSKFQEMSRRNAMFGTSDPDFGFNKMFQADMWLGSQMNLDSVMFRTIQWSVWDQLKQFSLVDINHSWNRARHTMLVTGHDPYYDVYCEVYCKVQEDLLWEDPWVKQWIGAKCKLNVARSIGTFTVNLLGGVTVNTALYTDEAKSEIEECENTWKDMLQGDWIITN